MCSFGVASPQLQATLWAPSRWGIHCGGYQVQRCHCYLCLWPRCQQRGRGCRFCSAREVQVPCGTAALWYHSSFYFKKSFSKKCRWLGYFLRCWFRVYICKLSFSALLQGEAYIYIFFFPQHNRRKLPRGWFFFLKWRQTEVAHVSWMKAAFSLSDFYSWYLLADVSLLMPREVDGVL